MNGIALPTPPIISATNVLFDDAELLFGANDDLLARQSDRLDATFQYGAISTPTVDAVAGSIARLENAAAALLTPSGQSAVMLVVSALARPGGALLVPDSLTYSTQILFEDLAKRLQFNLCRLDINELENITEQSLSKRDPFALFLEVPGGFGFETPDVDRILALAKQLGVPSIVDNTWASSVFFRPVERGADFVVLSMSKIYGGPAGVSLGAIATSNRADALKMRRLAALFGLNVAPEAAARLSLCIATLHARAFIQDAATRIVMAHIKDSFPTARLLHPALPDHPDHARWANYFTGACPIFTISFDNISRDALAGAMRESNLFRAALGWGGTVSSHYLFDPSGWRLPTSTTFDGDAFIRLYVALEDPADLREDIVRALSKVMERM